MDPPRIKGTINNNKYEPLFRKQRTPHWARRKHVVETAKLSTQTTEVKFVMGDTKESTMSYPHMIW